MKNNYRRNIGSVSRGTDPRDLIPDFIWELGQMKPLHREHSTLISQIEKRMVSCRCEIPCEGRTLRENSELHEEQYWESEDASQDLDLLCEALNKYCLPYFYFGEYDGEYGFWISIPSLNCDFDGLRVEDLSEVSKGYTGEVLHINDHGNTSLYSYSRGKAREIWAVV